MRKLLIATLLTVGIGMIPRPAQAFLITGELDLSGSVEVTCPNPPTCTAGILDFLPPVGGGFGIEQVSQATNQGYFTVFNGGVPTSLFGTSPFNIQELDLTGASLAPGPEGTFPELLGFETTPSIIQPVNFFTSVQSSPKPSLTLSLLSIAPCQEGCAFGFAPQFNVSETFDVNNVPQTTVFMNITGNVCDPGTAGAQCNHYSGTISAQFPGQTPEQLIAFLQTNGYVATSFSASKIAAAPGAVPEPASLLLFGTGTVVLAGLRRRRVTKAKKAAEANKAPEL